MTGAPWTVGVFFFSASFVMFVSLFLWGVFDADGDASSR